MRTPSPPYCGLDLAPPLADRFVFGVAPIDYGPVFLLMPFGFHLAVDTLPSGTSEQRLQVRLGCLQLSPLCPFRLLHTFHSLRPARNYPRFWIRHPSPERRGDFNPLDQCAAQRTLWACPTSHGRTSSDCSLGLADAARGTISPRAAVGPPGSRAWRFRACRGSPTARGPQGARTSAPCGVAFRFV